MDYFSYANHLSMLPLAVCLAKLFAGCSSVSEPCNRTVAQALILYICLAVVFGPLYQGKNLGQSARVADAAELCWRHTADLDWRGVAWPFEIR